MKRKIIILNSPPKAGKNTIADYLSTNHGLYHECLKNELYRIISHILNMSLEEVIYYCNHVELKELPNKLFGNISPRQYLIELSENFMKKIHGKDVLGIRLANNMSIAAFEICGYVLSDGGYGGTIEELLPVVNKFGVDNILVVRVHRDGCTFVNDTRKYLLDDHLSSYGIKSIDYFNNFKNIDELHSDLDKLIKEICNVH